MRITEKYKGEKKVLNVQREFREKLIWNDGLREFGDDDDVKSNANHVTVQPNKHPQKPS